MDPAREQANILKNDDIQWIDNHNDLQAFCNNVRDSGWIAFDTEFMRERTYFAQLALVQIADDTQVACIDPLAINDLAPLVELLLDQNLLKVVHAGRQDFEIVYDLCGQVPGPVFDTQVAAGLLGMGEQAGYAALVSRVCGVDLGKGHQRADWTRRPLDARTVEYAANDVIYLRDVFQQLNGELNRLNRASWLDEEQQTLVSLDTYTVDPDTMWTRVKGARKLKGVEVAIAQAVASWREQTAKDRNRPRKHILPDELILDIAQRKPRDITQLLKLRDAPGKTGRNDRDAIIDCVIKSLELPEDRWPQRLPRSEQFEFDPSLANALTAVVDLVARQNDISPGILTTSAELRRVAAGHSDVRLLSGWRNDIAGTAVQRFLTGKTAMTAEKGQLVLRELDN